MKICSANWIYNSIYCMHFIGYCTQQSDNTKYHIYTSAKYNKILVVKDHCFFICIKFY